MSLNHIGFAVRSADESQKAFEAVGAKFYHFAEDKDRNLSFRFANLPPERGGVVIELITPLDNTRPCPVTNMIEKSPCTIYHICMKVPDLDAEINRLRNLGFKQLGRVITANLHGYPTKGVFMFNRGTGLMELIQEITEDEYDKGNNFN